MKFLACAIVAILFSQNLLAETGTRGAILYKHGPVARCLVELALPEFGPKLEVVDYLFQVSDERNKVLVDIVTQDGFSKRGRFGIVVTTSDSAGWQYAQVNEEPGLVATSNVIGEVELIIFSPLDQSHSSIKKLDASVCF